MPATAAQRAAIIAGDLTATPDECETMRDTFRDGVLAAMDSTMRKVFMEQFGGMATEKWGKAGARDADLPELFKAIDAQFYRNLAYNGVTTDARTEAERLADDFDKADQRWNSQ